MIALYIHMKIIIFILRYFNFRFKLKMANVSNQKLAMVGIIGYSGSKFDLNLGEKLIKQSFDELETKFGNNIVIVSGLTNIGIPGLAYKEAFTRGWKTCGIASKKAENHECFKCDEVIIVGDNWGDESLTFLNKIDIIVKIGGGKQSVREFEEAKKMNKITFEHELPV